MILTPGQDYTVSASGLYTFAAAHVGKQVTIKYQSSIPAVSALAQLGMGLQTGYIGQPAWGYLTSNYPDQAIGYSGLAYVYAAAYDLGETAEVVNHSFEIQTPYALTAAGDANLASVALDMLTNARYGAAFPSSRIGSLQDWYNYSLAANLVASPVFAEQKPGAEWLQYLLLLTNTDVTWSQGKLKFVPLGDAPAGGNGIQWYPDTTPKYDLTEDHFLVDAPEDDPITIERRANEDVCNHVRVEYSNRANQYNTEVLEVKDAADIDRRGLRTKQTIEARAVCDSTVAAGLAALLLQRELGVRNTYKFRLPWSFGLLEPLDLVTVTDPYLGLARTPVRINRITETDGGDFEVEAEDCPIGMASAPAYGAQAGVGFAHDYNASPGPVGVPFFFEPPAQLTQTGLEVWMAVSGTNALWGGCRVWASTDGVQYRQVGRITGGARFGALTSSIGTSGADTVGVLLTGQGGTIASGTAEDAAALQTLLFVGDSTGGEYLAYQTAALTGTKAYNLTGLTRGAYYTTPKARLANQATVVRVDQAIAKGEPLDVSQVGKKLFFKFTSFNVYGGGEQSLADVAAYTYTPTGYMLKLAPPAPSSLTFDGTSFVWPAVTYPRNLLAGYEIRFQYGQNQSYADATPLQQDVITDNPYTPPAMPQGVATFMLRTVDVWGNRSADGPLVATNLGDPTTSNVVTLQDYKAAGWPGVITGVAGVSGGNIVATNAASAFGSSTQPAFSIVKTDAAFTATYAGISYATPDFSPARAGTMTLLHTVNASQYQVQYRPTNSASAFATSGTQPAFSQGGAAAAFSAQPAWQAWPGAVEATVQPYQFRVVCGVGTVQQSISRFTVQVDVPDINLKLTGVAISAAGTRLAAAIGKFSTITNVNLTLQGGGTAVSAQFTDRRTDLGPNVICINAAGAQVAGTVDALIQGF